MNKFLSVSSNEIIAQNNFAGTPKEFRVGLRATFKNVDFWFSLAKVLRPWTEKTHLTGFVAVKVPGLKNVILLHNQVSRVIVDIILQKTGLRLSRVGTPGSGLYSCKVAFVLAANANWDAEQVAMCCLCSL